MGARLRAVLQQSHVELPALAERLGVDEGSLRLSMDERSPRPSIDVLAAVVRHMGVDPTWLVTGEYSRLTHFTAVDDDGELGEDAVRRLLTELTGDGTPWPRRTPPTGSPINDPR